MHTIYILVRLFSFRNIFSLGLLLFVVLSTTDVVACDNLIRIGNKIFSAEVVDEAIHLVIRIQNFLEANPTYYKQIQLGGLTISDLTPEYLSECPPAFKAWADTYLLLNHEAFIYLKDQGIDLIEFGKYIKVNNITRPLKLYY